MSDAARGHSVLISEVGGLHPVVLSGYLADPGLPLRYARQAIGGELAMAAYDTSYTPAGAGPGAGPVVAVYSARRPGGLNPLGFNPFGSLVAAAMGCLLVPLYGTVWMCKPPDPATGVIGKLSGQVKQAIAHRMGWVRLALSGQAPSGDGDGMFPPMPQEAYVRLRDALGELIRAHRAAQAARTDDEEPGQTADEMAGQTADDKPPPDR